jgi:TetR/AcrR family tetracycline transcriptional repressor
MKIDQQSILTATTELLNQDGIDALSMRSLAKKLDVKAASLYFHIKNKEDLFEQISEGISKKVYLEIQKTDQPDLTILANIFRSELKKIQDSPRIFEITSPLTEYRTKLIEFTLSQLKMLNIPEKYLTTAGNVYNNYILSFVSDEQFFAKVDPAEFDMTFQSPIDMADPDDSFEYGLNIILKGLI